MTQTLEKEVRIASEGSSGPYVMVFDVQFRGGTESVSVVGYPLVAGEEVHFGYETSFSKEVQDTIAGMLLLRFYGIEEDDL